MQELYSDYRTSCLNRKYYGQRLQAVKRLNLGLEIILAIAASSTVASAKLFQSTSFFSEILPWAAAPVALLAVAKPLLGLDIEIERLSKLATSYSELYEQLRNLVGEIFVEHEVSAMREWQVQSLQAAMTKLASLDDLNPSRRRLKALQAEIREEIPSHCLWYPDDDPPLERSLFTSEAVNTCRSAERPDPKLVPLPTKA